MWDALADTPAEAANLRARSDLLLDIRALVEAGDWSPAEAAKRCGLTEPRLEELMDGNISKFSLDSLIDVATALGRKVSVHVDAA